jgi:hypothetical protein
MLSDSIRVWVLCAGDALASKFIPPEGDHQEIAPVQVKDTAESAVRAAQFPKASEKSHPERLDADAAARSCLETRRKDGRAAVRRLHYRTGEI